MRVPGLVFRHVTAPGRASVREIIRIVQRSAAQQARASVSAGCMQEAPGGGPGMTSWGRARAKRSPRCARPPTRPPLRALASTPCPPCLSWPRGASECVARDRVRHASRSRDGGGPRALLGCMRMTRVRRSRVDKGASILWLRAAAAGGGGRILWRGAGQTLISLFAGRKNGRPSRRA